jgi:hypothetical protein
MAYTAEISRNNPTCFLFLIDQSGWPNQAAHATEEIPTLQLAQE